MIDTLEDMLVEVRKYSTKAKILDSTYSNSYIEFEGGGIETIDGRWNLAGKWTDNPHDIIDLIRAKTNYGKPESEKIHNLNDAIMELNTALAFSGMGRFDIVTLLQRYVEVSDILLRDKGYDRQGWEKLHWAAEAAKNILNAIGQKEWIKSDSFGEDCPVLFDLSNSGWISVDLAIPNSTGNSHYVKAKDIEGNEYDAFLNWDRWFKYSKDWGSCEIIGNKITHWQPLPPAPEDR